MLQRPHGDPKGPIRRARFVTGVTLIAASFLVYPAYVVVPFLSLSDRVKAALYPLIFALSWGVFSIGIFLSGREGYDWLKQRWTR